MPLNDVRCHHFSAPRLYKAILENAGCSQFCGRITHLLIVGEKKAKSNVSNQIKCSCLESYSSYLLAPRLFSQGFSDRCCYISRVKKTAPATGLPTWRPELGARHRNGNGNGRAELTWWRGLGVGAAGAMAGRGIHCPQLCPGLSPGCWQ